MYRFAFPLLISMLLVSYALGDAPKPAFPNVDGLVTPAVEQTIQGQDAIILLKTGLVITDAQFDSVISDRKTGTPKLIAYSQGKRKSKKPIDSIYSMRIGGDLFRTRYHSPTRSLLLINATEANRIAEERMNDSSRVIRAPQSQAEIIEGVEDVRKIFNEALEEFPDAGLHVSEGEQVLLLTDYPKPIAMQMVAVMDRMCEAMNDLFGLPKGANCWRGKALVVAVSTRDLYIAFEREVMNNPNAGNSTSLHHANSRRFLSASFREKPDKQLAEGICWSLSSGYLMRYRSNFPLPSWLHRGTHTWVTQEMFPNPTRLPRHRKSFQRELKSRGSLSGLLSQTQMDNDRYYSCGLIVRFLIDADKAAFSQFLEDCKLGVPWRDALQTNFGINEEQLVSSYGRTLGVPHLTP